jgi:hypothetical protein
VSNKINTANIERSNGTLRQMDSHLQRKSMKFAKENRHFQAKLSVIMMYYNFIKPHGTLSRNRDKSYTPRTPALVTGIITENWSIDYAFRKPRMRKYESRINLRYSKTSPPRSLLWREGSKKEIISFNYCPVLISYKFTP